MMGGEGEAAWSSSVYLMRLSTSAVNKLCSWVAPPKNLVSASRIRLVHVSALCLIETDTSPRIRPRCIWSVIDYFRSFASPFRLKVFRKREASFAHGGTNFFPIDT